MPVFPFWVINIVPAFFNMSLFKYCSATFIGIIPGTFIYVWIGKNINEQKLYNVFLDEKVIIQPNLFFDLGATRFAAGKFLVHP